MKTYVNIETSSTLFVFRKQAPVFYTYSHCFHISLYVVGYIYCPCLNQTSSHSGSRNHQLLPTITYTQATILTYLTNDADSRNNIHTKTINNVAKYVPNSQCSCIYEHLRPWWHGRHLSNTVIMPLGEVYGGYVIPSYIINQCINTRNQSSIHAIMKQCNQTKPSCKPAFISVSQYISNKVFTLTLCLYLFPFCMQPN